MPVDTAPDDPIVLPSAGALLYVSVVSLQVLLAIACALYPVDWLLLAKIRSVALFTVPVSADTLNLR